MKPLILDENELRKLGLYSEAIYTVEYDMPTEWKKALDKEQKAFLHYMRWKLLYHLKFKLHAIKNLNSSWFIEQDKLDSATELLTQIIDEYASQGFDVKRKIRIIPIFTTEEAHETFEDRKAQYLLEYISESERKVDKGLHDKVMGETTLWNCKMCVEYVESILASQLKNHSRRNEIIDECHSLDDKIHQFENLKLNMKEQKKIEAKKRAKRKT